MRRLRRLRRRLMIELLWRLGAYRGIGAELDSYNRTRVGL